MDRGEEGRMDEGVKRKKQVHRRTDRQTDRQTDIDVFTDGIPSILNLLFVKTV